MGSGFRDFMSILDPSSACPPHPHGAGGCLRRNGARVIRLMTMMTGVYIPENYVFEENSAKY